MTTLLSIGHGFSATYVERLLKPKGWRIIATTRSTERAEAMRARGIEARIGPGSDLTGRLQEASALLTSVSPNAQGDPFLAEYRDAMNAAQHLDWVGYLSTTGVYGDHKGAWVDESTPTRPTTKRGAWREAAEQEWLSLALPVHVFRLAGIYGPGRGPFSKVRNGTARRVIKPGQVFSRIHVEDIAQVVIASLSRPRPGAIYNVNDDDPAPPEDVLAYAAELLGLPLPPEVDFETAEMSEMARSFYAECKRTRNQLIKDELGVQLRYPDYKSGLKALLESEEG